MTKDEYLTNVATNDTSQERVDKTSKNVHEPWSPVSIGVDITEEGAHVVGIYALDNDTSQVFYAKYYPVPQRKPLTDEEIEQMGLSNYIKVVRQTEAAHGIKGLV